MAKFELVLSILMILGLIAAKCDDGKSKPDPDNPKGLCSHIMKVCDDAEFYDDKEHCMEDLESKEECRLECVAESDDCDPIHECLFWEIGFGATVDYCSDDGISVKTGGDADGDSDSDSDSDADGDVGANFLTLDECSESMCVTENNACLAVPDCVSIFEICYTDCEDNTCWDSCVLDYPGGYTAHDNLLACLKDYCIEFLM